MNTIAECPRSLVGMQASIARLLLEPERLATGRGRRAIERWLGRPGRVDPAVGVQVHAAGYPARIIEALADTFEALRYVVGRDELAALADRYARARRPSSYNLNDAGAHMARYLARDPLTLTYPFLPDLAALEWALAAAFHARAEPAVEPSAIAMDRADALAESRMILQPSVAVILSRWPVMTIWELRDTPRARLDAELRERPEHVLVYRLGLSVRLARISHAEADVLRALRRGCTLGEALARAERRGSTESEVGDWFARWQSLGLVVGFVGAPA